MKCPNCGAQRNAQDRYCPYCQTRFDPYATVPEKKQEIHIHYHQEPVARVESIPVAGNRKSPKNRLAALLLCFFLGFFGAHKFYLGRPVMGVVYLFTYGLFGIGWLADMIVLTLGNPKDKDGRLLTWH